MSTSDKRVRLQKFLSDAGVTSRRNAEALILEGRVLVNGQVVDELPAFVDPAQDKVVANGVPVRAQRRRYLLLHKPKNVVCTNRDPAGRLRAVDLLPPNTGRVFPVGRLDADSTGLLLLTNDGELGERISHPRYGIPKTYRVEVRGRVPGDLPAQMKKGVHLAEGKARANEVEVTHASKQRSVLMVTLREGRNRQVRRMLSRLGYPVKTLKRVQIGPVSLRGLPVGAVRPLKSGELNALRRELDAAAREVAEGRDRGRKPGRKRATRRDDKAQPAPQRPAPPARKKDEGPGRRLIT